VLRDVIALLANEPVDVRNFSSILSAPESKHSYQLLHLQTHNHNRGMTRQSTNHAPVNLKACSSTVEQGTHNPLVVGSNPARPTNFQKY
jgi:hypothetical protein